MATTEMWYGHQVADDRHMLPSATVTRAPKAFTSPNAPWPS
jgi:hypothetical protein